jgi:hypothetical protein
MQSCLFLQQGFGRAAASVAVDPGVDLVGEVAAGRLQFGERAVMRGFKAQR